MVVSEKPTRRPRATDADYRSKAEVDAEVDRLRAEAEKFRAEAAQADAEADAARSLTVFDVRIKAAMATDAETRANLKKLELDRDQDFRSVELASNLHHHRYDFVGGVDASSVSRCIDRLNWWDRMEKPSELEIVFYSPGGDVFSGMWLYDRIQEMRSKGWYFTTTALGYAASMGGILVQAGDRRVMGREAYLLLHEVSTAAIGKVGELEDEVEFAKTIQRRVTQIFASRAKVSAKVIENRMKRKEFWVDSTEALELGLVDEVR